MFEKVHPKKAVLFHARLYSRRRTLETESTSRKFPTQLPQNYTLTQTTNRFRTAKQKENHFRKTKIKGEHIRNGTLHIYCKLRQKHTLFKLQEKQTKKTDRSLR